MKEISYKQAEALSNEYILFLLIAVLVVGAALFYGLKFLKEKNILGDFKGKRLKVKETSQLTAFSKAILLEVNGQDFVVVESTRNVQLVNSDSSAIEVHSDVDRTKIGANASVSNNEASMLDVKHDSPNEECKQEHIKGE